MPKESDPAAMYLLKRMISYANSEEFQPVDIIEPDEIIKLFNTTINLNANFSTDEALDPFIKRNE